VSALRGEVKGKWRLSLCAYKIGVSTVRAAFAIVHQCRRLPVLLETFLGSFPLFVGCWILAECMCRRCEIEFPYD
jgi:hypothetical protein